MTIRVKNKPWHVRLRIYTIFGGERFIAVGCFRWLFWAKFRAKIAAMWQDYAVIPRFTYDDAPQYGSAVGIEWQIAYLPDILDHPGGRQAYR